MEAFDDEKQKLLDQVKSGRQLTQEECDFLNESTRDNLECVLKDFKQKALAQMEIKPTDSADEVMYKIRFADQLINWLRDLFSWLLDKIKEIFAKQEEDFQWRVEMTKKLFKYLWSLF